MAPRPDLLTDARVPGTPIRVVVVTYNPGATLASFLTSLRGASDRALDVVVADNGSTDGSVDAVADRGDLTVVHTGGNIGYGRAANVGAGAYTSFGGRDSTWIVVANPDVEWTPGSLDRLLAAGETLSSAAVLGPRITDPDGEPYPSARAFPDLVNGVGHALLVRVWPANPWTRAYHDGVVGDGDDTARTGWLSGACMLVRRDAYESVHGFDPQYFMFFEDVDLCDRLRAQGWDRIYVPDAEVIHLGGASWRDGESHEMSKIHHRSAARYLTGKYDRWYQLPVRVALRTGLAVRGVIAHT